MSESSGHDPVIRNQWHALAALDELTPGRLEPTLLVGERIAYGLDRSAEPIAVGLTGDGPAPAESSETGNHRPLPVRAHCGYLWTSTGQPPDHLFAVPEADEPDRRTLNAMTVGIQVSAPRAIENFLDMAHFPYVHTHLLGEEPHTEVADYRIEMRDGEIWAVDCTFYQPQAAAASTEGVMAEYIYRVPHPYAAMLYKSAPGHTGRMDAIGIFIHPLTETHIRAHLFLSLLDDVSTDSVIRRFQQGIVSQDKPILENQYPKLLPLDPRAETPIRADKSAIAYRRWLTELGVTYGVIPAVSG